MNRNSHPDVSYRLLFLGRHGDGYHNAAESEYGTEAWDVRSSSSFRKNQHFPNNHLYSATGPSKTATKT